MSALSSLERPAATPGIAYSDIRSLQRIDTDGDDGIRAAAQQFESLFIGMMLKSMREANAVFAEGNPLSSPELTMHQEMLDQQWAIHMSESGGMGLAPIIEAQLRGERRPADAGVPAQSSSLERSQDRHARADSRPSALTLRVPADGQDPASSATAGSGPGHKRPAFADRRDFVERLLPEIERVLDGLGLDARAVLAQSALETGWGQRMIHAPDGASSHNLFGIKAGRGWQGDRVAVKTVEVIDGVAEVQTAEFRSYPDVRAAVEDYVQFLRSDDRYRDVLDAADRDRFADALQQSGYATDPAYAGKIKAVIGSLDRLMGS